MEILLKNLKFKYILTCILVTFVISCLISIAPISIEDCKCSNKPEVINVKDYATRRKLLKSEHSLAILVPFRNRFEELLIFAPHMKKFLDKQDIDFHIFVLNQVDRYRFNRASLINVGFLETQKDFDYIAMHDVDLLPMNDKLQYFYPDKSPLHISSPELHPRYHYPTFIGGILLLKREHFQQVNGMSNKYWGWGLEDDEFYVRLKEAGLNITRPPNLPTGTQSTFKHIHDRNHRKRDMAKCFNQREVTRKRDRQTGLHNVAYKLDKSINATIADTPITILNISLMCDESITPWCICESVNIVKDKKTKIRRVQGAHCTAKYGKNFRKRLCTVCNFKFNGHGDCS